MHIHQLSKSIDPVFGLPLTAFITLNGLWLPSVVQRPFPSSCRRPLAAWG